MTMKLQLCIGVESCIEQILVLVATIQMRFEVFIYLNASNTLKTVVEKVSLKLANMQGLVGPKL